MYTYNQSINIYIYIYNLETIDGSCDFLWFSTHVKNLQLGMVYIALNQPFPGPEDAGNIGR